MLRACFLNNGAQKILAKPYKGELKINDYSSMQEEEAQRAALSIRNRLSHRKLHIEKGEVAGLELTLLPHGKTRLHIDVDLLVADVQSLHILLRDIFTVYNGGELPQESKEWNFATYLKEQETEENEEKERAKEYWNGRLETLPKGPDLPLAKRPEEIQKPIFKRRVVRIQKREWENLQNRAKEYQTTQAMLLLTAYSAVLERWSRNKRFLVNIPYFNRKTEKTGLEDVIADFTTLLLLEVNCDGKPTFLELLHRIEKQLHEDMKNTSYSGVQVQRDMSKLHGEASVSAPIVFACNLGTPLVNSEFQKCIGKFSYMISQTPQVWIDFQSYEDEEGIQLTWDSVDELFPEFMIQDMINSFEKLLHRLETENWEQKFDVLPENRKKFLEKLCDVGTPEQTTCIHAAFLQRAREHPEKVALVDTGKEYSVTYGELKEYATEIAEELYRSGIRNEPVAITLPRGYEQIMAIMGVLLSGNMYVPVSGSQPKERRKLIHEKTGVRYVITNNEWKKVIEWPNETKLFLVEEMKKSEKVELPVVSPSDSAYIIMTSGSTGVPKGVEIAHASAWNTIQDINKKYQVSEQDIGLAVSAIDFDLSLYDIFGILLLTMSQSIRETKMTLTNLEEKENLNQNEKIISSIWKEILGIEYVNKKDNFYSVGGDSLLIAQVVTKMRKSIKQLENISWDQLMREVLENPTLEGMSNIISQKEHSIQKMQKTSMSKYIHKYNETENAPVKVISFFHAGTGRLIDYKHMVENLLDKDMSDTQLIGFTYGEYQQYMETPVESLVQDRANLYAETLLEFNVDRYTLVGYCVGGFLALETAKILLENGKKVKLIMIDSRLCQHTISNQLLMEYAYGLSMELDMDNTPYSIKPVMLKEALEKILNGENRNIKNSELTKLSDEYAELGEVFTNLLDMTHEERIKALFNSKKQHNFNGEESTISMLNLLYDIYEHTFNAMMRYRPEGIYSGDITYINATEVKVGGFNMNLWNQLEQLKKMTWIDLSHEFGENTLVWYKKS